MSLISLSYRQLSFVLQKDPVKRNTAGTTDDSKFSQVTCVTSSAFAGRAARDWLHVTRGGGLSGCLVPTRSHSPESRGPRCDRGWSQRSDFGIVRQLNDLKYCPKLTQATVVAWDSVRQYLGLDQVFVWPMLKGAHMVIVIVVGCTPDFLAERFPLRPDPSGSRGSGGHQRTEMPPSFVDSSPAVASELRLSTTFVSTTSV